MKRDPDYVRVIMFLKDDTTFERVREMSRISWPITEHPSKRSGNRVTIWVPRESMKDWKKFFEETELFDVIEIDS